MLLILGLLVAGARLALGPPEPARLREARAFAPSAAAMAATALLLGLDRRRRAAHASPTAAWLAKRAGLLALAGTAAWMLTPLPGSPGLLCLAACAAGGVWIANLPPRL